MPEAARWGALAIAVVPGSAAAHSPIPGIEGFYVGMLHPIASLPQLLALVALSLLLGLGRPGAFAVGWAAFALTCVVGVVLGQWRPDLVVGGPWLLGLAAATAALAAGAPQGLRAAAPALAAAIGAGVGLASTPAPGPWTPTLITVSGSVVGACVALLYAGGVVGWLRGRFEGGPMRAGLRSAAALVAGLAVATSIAG